MSSFSIKTKGFILQIIGRLMRTMWQIRAIKVSIEAWSCNTKVISAESKAVTIQF